VLHDMHVLCMRVVLDLHFNGFHILYSV